MGPLESIQGPILFILSDQTESKNSQVHQLGAIANAEVRNTFRIISADWWNVKSRCWYSAEQMVEEERRDLAHRSRTEKDEVGSNAEEKGPGSTFPSEKG